MYVIAGRHKPLYSEDIAPQAFTDLRFDRDVAAVTQPNFGSSNTGLTRSAGTVYRPASGGRLGLRTPFNTEAPVVAGTTSTHNFMHQTGRFLFEVLFTPHSGTTRQAIVSTAAFATGFYCDWIPKPAAAGLEGYVFVNITGVAACFSDYTAFNVDKRMLLNRPVHLIFACDGSASSWFIQLNGEFIPMYGNTFGTPRTGNSAAALTLGRWADNTGSPGNFTFHRFRIWDKYLGKQAAQAMWRQVVDDSPRILRPMFFVPSAAGLIRNIRGPMRAIGGVQRVGGVNANL